MSCKNQITKQRKGNPQPLCDWDLVLNTVGHVKKGLKISKFSTNWEGLIAIKEAYDNSHLRFAELDSGKLLPPIMLSDWNCILSKNKEKKREEIILYCSSSISYTRIQKIKQRRNRTMDRKRKQIFSLMKDMCTSVWTLGFVTLLSTWK